jgi:hypothetical protein
MPVPTSQPIDSLSFGQFCRCHSILANPWTFLLRHYEEGTGYKLSGSVQ